MSFGVLRVLPHTASRDDQFIINNRQDGTVYLREISAVDREFILRHYRAYGGLKPPPIDHDGVDDAFLEMN